jgi:hypothetical protein
MDISAHRVFIEHDSGTESAKTYRVGEIADGNRTLEALAEWLGAQAASQAVADLAQRIGTP